MERRRYPRIPVKLHATLIGQKTMPRGCRIINLSQQGALLQCEHNGRPLAIGVGEAVELHFTLKRRTDGHRRFRLQATVRRVTERHIGVEFQEPQPELLLPFETHREDDRQPTEWDPRPRRAAIHDAVDHHPGNGDDGAFAIEGLKRTWRYFGVGPLAIVMIGLPGAYLLYVKVDARFSRLEAAMAAHARTHAERGDQRSTLALLETQLEQLKQRVDQLETVGRENQSPHTPSPVSPGNAITDGAEPNPSPSALTDSQTEQVSLPEPVPQELEPTSHPPKAPSEIIQPDIERQGSWVINLLSSQNKAAVDRFSAKARKEEILVTQTLADVKGTQYWRVQLTGFATADEAKSYAERVKQKLGLKDVWIFRDVD